MRHPLSAPAPVQDERGIVLAAAILFMLLSSVLVLTFMATAIGERSQSSNVQTAKLSLYAADAGVRTEQQYLANYAQAKLDSCLTAFNNAGNVGKIVTQPTLMFPAGSLPAAYIASSTNPSFVTSASIVWADSVISQDSQAYDYLFTIQSTGNAGAAGRRSVQAQGMLRVSATRGDFTDYLLFMDTFTMADGSTIWLTSAGTFDGRLHTNTGFKFAYKPTFYDQVSQHGINATFYNNGKTPVVANANNNGNIDVPNFYGGYLRNQPTIPLPTNSYNQQQAALGMGQSSTPVTNADINQAIGNGNSNATPPAGIYVPNTGGATPSVKGGVYIQGNVDAMKVWTDTTTHQQYYQVTQGSTTKTILVDPNLPPSTKVWNGTNLSGAPSASYAGNPPMNVVYSSGSISGLRGPDRGPNGYINPAIATNNQLLIAANNDIVIQGDLTCDDFTEKNNVLGIFSFNGSVRIGTSAANDLNLDAFVMATGASGQFAVDNYSVGQPRGNVNLRGGAVSRYYGAFYTFDTKGNVKTGYGRNFHYDRRGLSPPYFPKTQRYDKDMPTARTIAWKEI